MQAEAYLLLCQRYIELNPVRAGIVADPAHYGWSSYRANALGEPDALLTAHPSTSPSAPTTTHDAPHIATFSVAPSTTNPSPICASPATRINPSVTTDSIGR